MKQYIIIKRARGSILKDEIDTTIYTDENLYNAGYRKITKIEE